MKKNILSFCFLFLTVMLSDEEAFAQQNPQYSMYMFNTMAINPAYAGSYDEISATLLYRNQWLNFDGAPKTASFSIHAPFKKKHIGLGLSLINDQLGVIKRNSANAAYSYRLFFQKSSLAFGFKTGFANLNAKLSDVQLTPTNNSSDPAFSSNVNVASINFGSGIYWYSKKHYVSFSIPELYSVKISSGLAKDVSEIQKAHYFLAAGYVYPVNSIVKIKPSLLMKITFAAPVKTDITANVYFYDIFGVGLSYHTFDSFSVIAEFYSKKNMWVGYTFDYTLTSLRKYNFGSHEIMFRYNFGFDKSGIISTRFF